MKTTIHKVVAVKRKQSVIVAESYRPNSKNPDTQKRRIIVNVELTFEVDQVIPKDTSPSSLIRMDLVIKKKHHTPEIIEIKSVEDEDNDNESSLIKIADSSTHLSALEIHDDAEVYVPQIGRAHVWTPVTL